MRLLLDTQILIWMVNGDRRLGGRRLDDVTDAANSLHVSAVVAFEYSDLQRRRRIPVDEPIAELVQRFDLVLEDFPARCWQVAAGLPPIHSDPVDRMLVAHAVAGGFTVATADANIRRYPVSAIW